jgi:hypothetical protein
MSSAKGKSFKSTDAIRLKDEATKELLFRVVQYIERNPLLSYGFEFIEYTFDAAGTIAIPNPLGFIPKDLILTSKKGSGDVTFNYDSFTKTTLSVTVTGSCSIRALIGTYRSE